MIQGFDPRTGEPVGEPVAETTDAALDAIVAAAVAAFPAWSAFPRRAEALEAVADALDARAGELAAIADTETALGGERLIGEVARTTGQLRLFAAVLRDGGYTDPVVTSAQGVTPDLRRVDRAGRPGGRVRGVKLPVRVFRGRRRHRLGAGRGLPGRGEGTRGTPGHLGRDRRDRGRGAGVRRSPSGTFGLVHGVQAGLRLLRHPAVAAAGFTGSTTGGLALAQIAAERPVPIPFYGELGSVNPSVVLPGAAFSRPAASPPGTQAR